MRIPAAFICSTVLPKKNNDQHVAAYVGTSVTRVKKRKSKKPTLQTKGGGSPKVPTAQENAQAQIELERARAQMAQEQAARDKAAAAAEQQAKIERARAAQANAYNAAQGYGTQQVAGRGFDQGLVDKYNVLGLYGNAIDTQRSGFAEDNVNPVFSTNTAFNDAVAAATGAYRSGTRNDFTSSYGDNFAYDKFADTADDAILESILNSKRADALATIDAAKARGQLNDVGYTRSLSKLDEQGKAGMSDLQKLGGGVLSGYRADLDAQRKAELDKIGGLDLTQLYDPSGFGTKIGNTVSNYNNNLEGDIYKAIGNTSFFDPSTIISGSGAIQGYYNPTTTKQNTVANNPLLSAFTTDEQQKNTTGVGNTGVF